MYTRDFDYELPPELIATQPHAERTQSRLLGLNRQTGAITHAHFYQLLDYLRPEDCLILNNTQVIKARLFGQKDTGGQVELLVERILGDFSAMTYIRASKSPKVGSTIHLAAEIKLIIEEKIEGLYRVRLIADRSFLSVLEHIGLVPLPPYMQREAEDLDDTQYQTVYAKVPGAVAAPTAGLHFDQDLLQKISDKGIAIGTVTLHVGAGTFQGVRVENITEHRMHSEWLDVPQSVCDLIAKTRERGGRVVAVGTTVVRSLETAALCGGELKPYSGETQIFIYPGFKFQVVDALVTNFHLPRSTLLMLVSAFAGRESILAAYQVAIAERYPFFSYGAAMWIA